MGYFSFEYGKKQRRNGNYFISVRDINENKLLEIEQKGENIILYTNSRNDSSTTFVLPKEIFDKIHKDINQSN